MSRLILECFTPISYLFRRSWRGCNVKKRHAGARMSPVAGGMVRRILPAGSGRIGGVGVGANSLDQLYVEHLRVMAQRTDRSLAAAGFDALVIEAGSPPRQFLDDQDYPYKVNPHFKAWVPIVDNPQSVLIYRPGARPQLLFHQPSDYWHKAAKLPQESWSHALDVIPLPDPSKASQHWAA